MPPEIEGSSTEVVEQKTPEQIAADEQEAEEAFSSGVERVLGEPKDEKKTEGDATDKTKGTGTEENTVAAEAAAKATADAAKAKADAAAAAAADPWKGVPQVVRDEFAKLNNTVTSQLRNLAGHIGNFKQQIERISTTAKAAAEDKGAAAPTKVDIAEALTDPAKWKQLQEDFPEWMQPVAAELTRLRKEMAAVAKSAEARPAPVAAPAAVAAEPVNTAAIISEAEERAFVRLKHPDWKAICATDSFAKDWLPKQSDDIKAKAASDSADDAVAVFDAYKAHQKKVADEAAAKVRNEKRLQSAVPAQGSAEPPMAGMDEDEALNAGVKKTLRRVGH